MTALFHALIHLARLRWLGATFCALAMLCVSTHASAIAGATAHTRVDASVDITTTASATAHAQTKDRVWGFDQNSPLLIYSLRSASAETHLGISPTLPETASASSYAARGGASAFGILSRAGQYGIQPYAQLTNALKGTGLQAHHLVEARFAGVMGQNARQGLSVAVSRAEHQAFTNAWRQAIPYGAEGTGRATQEQVIQAARGIYANYPAILNALGL